MQYLTIGLAVLISLIALAREFLSPAFSRWTAVALALLLIGVAVLDLLQESERASVEAFSRTSGVLRSPEASAEANAEILLCTSRLRLPEDPRVVLMKEGSDVIAATMRDGRVSFSIVLRDEKDEVRASITENVWFVPTNPSAILDRNFDERGLEVLDAKGNPVLQVDLDRNIVRFARQTLTERRPSFGPLLTECGDDAPGGTMFKYPSAEFPGVRRVQIYRHGS